MEPAGCIYSSVGVFQLNSYITFTFDISCHNSTPYSSGFNHMLMLCEGVFLLSIKSHCDDSLIEVIPIAFINRMLVRHKMND